MSMVQKFKVPTGLRKKLMSKNLIFTVTSGRSGTALLARLMGLLPETVALHEPEPRLNFYLRQAQINPKHAARFLIQEKLPFIAAQNCAFYVETSHLYCKGFIEPLIAMGISASYIILKRNPRDVAISLFQMNVIPGKTFDGLLVLLKPDDRNVMPLVGWELMHDYQLCYWYALEIERRQIKYEGLFKRLGIRYTKIKMLELLNLDLFLGMCQDLGYKNLCLSRDFRDAFINITKVNQNPKDKAMPGVVLRKIDFDLDELEEEVLYNISFYEPDLSRQMEKCFNHIP